MTDLKVQLNAQIPSGRTFQSNRTVAVDNYETFRTKAIAAVEKEIVDHTAQVTILIGRDVPST